MSTLPSPSACPPWCAGHVPVDDTGVLHISTEKVLELASPCGTERSTAYVSLERRDGRGPGEPGVRVEGVPAVMSLASAERLTSAIRSLTEQAMEVIQ